MVAKCSLHLGKKLSLKHNKREYDKEKWNTDGHIDESRKNKNVVLLDTNLEKFFSDNFEEAIKNFNEKNKAKHPDRVTDCKKYKSEHIKDMQEAIIQIGDHETYVSVVEQLGQEKADDLYIKYLTSAFKKMKEDYPALKPVCAVIHMDETKNGTPHLHYDFLPVAHSERGLETRISLNGALAEIGYVRDKKDKFSERPYTRWLTDCRKEFEEFAQEFCRKEKLDIKIAPSEKSTRPHEDIQSYRVREEARKKILPVIKEYLIDGKKSKDLADEIIKNSQAVQDVFSENNRTIEKQLKQREYELTQREKDITQREKILNEQIKKVKQEKTDVTNEKQKIEAIKKDSELKKLDLLREKKKFELANSELEHRTLCTARLIANEIMRAVGYDPISNAIETIQLDNKGYVKERGVSYVHD